MASSGSFAAGSLELAISGNTKTDDRIIAQEVTIPANGATFTDEDAEKSRQAIMALGLFEKVEVALNQSAEQPVLNITVKEKKHDWYILPRLNRNGDGDITLGADWRENNYNGLNQRIKLTVAQKKFDDASKDKEVRLGFKFVYPRIVGTRFSSFFDVNALNVGIDEERDGATGEFERNKASIGGGFGRWFGKQGASQGLHVKLGARFTHYDHKYLSGDESLFFDATVVSLEASAVNTKVQDNLYSRDGQVYGIRLEQANEGLGSDVDYLHQSVFFRRYQPVGSVPHTNFNYQVQIASGDKSVFGDPIYDLSGAQSLRGFARETLEGDAFFLVNTEYLRPIFGKENVRGALLFDFGNAYDKIGDITDLDFEYGVGLGLRWKFKSWVGTELRIDAAYGLGDLGGTRIYVSTDAAF